MRACLSGRESTSLFLYRWNPAAFKIKNYDGETCLDLASPFESLCVELERLERINQLRSSQLEHHKREGSSGPRIMTRSKTPAAGSGGEFIKPGVKSWR